MLAGSVYKINENVRDNAFSVFEYDLLSKKDHAEEIDERIVIREMVLNLLVALGLVLGLLIYAYAGFQAVFVAGALLSITLILL